jgi:hypothetical protein
MTQAGREEIEAAFRHYFLTGPVLEDWVAWSQLFTDDDRHHGPRHGLRRPGVSAAGQGFDRWRTIEP